MFLFVHSHTSLNHMLLTYIDLYTSDCGLPPTTYPYRRFTTKPSLVINKQPHDGHPIRRH